MLEVITGSPNHRRLLRSPRWHEWRPTMLHVNGLFKSELIRRHGLWRDLEHLERSIMDWVDWYSNRRPHSWWETSRPQSTRPRTTADRTRALAQPSRDANDQSPRNRVHLKTAEVGACAEVHLDPIAARQASAGPAARSAARSPGTRSTKSGDPPILIAWPASASSTLTTRRSTPDDVALHLVPRHGHGTSFRSSRLPPIDGTTGRGWSPTLRLMEGFLLPFIDLCCCAGVVALALLVLGMVDAFVQQRD
jgi:Integrase core domain